MIHCVLRGHDFQNEVQVTAQVFFPAEKFTFGNNVQPQGYTVESVREADGFNAIVYKDGAKVAHHFFAFAPQANYLNERRVTMLALYHALQKVVPTFTPWGSLTGIRPSKLVREWMDNGCTDREIITRLMEPFCVSEEKARLALNVAHSENRVEKRIRNTIGIYVSVPFCPSRCVYCSFNTTQKPASEDFLESYVATLIRECREKSAQVREFGGEVSSIYIGGGTPTFLPENLLEKLLDAICENFSKSGIELTAEAGRPDTLTPAKLKILKKYATTRLAVNPQTLNDRTLKAIGRNHSAADFFTAFHHALEAGFPTINTDLIAGLPNETPDDMHRNMEALSRLAPENITIHTLALKRASRLNELRHEKARRNDNSENHENECADNDSDTPQTIDSMLRIAANFCAEMNLHPYYLYRQKNMAALFENIGYSQLGKECLYNVGMMAEVQTILGIGAGAVSKYVIGNKITREFNAKNPKIYIERQGQLHS